MINNLTAVIDQLRDVLTGLINQLVDVSMWSQAWDQDVRHMSCPTEFKMQLGEAFFAIAAAVLWILSAFTRMPSTAFDELAIDDLGEISEAFGRQSRRSAWAAICAAGAAILGAILVYAPSCLNLG